MPKNNFKKSRSKRKFNNVLAHKNNLELNLMQDMLLGSQSKVKMFIWLMLIKATMMKMTKIIELILNHSFEFLLPIGYNFVVVIVCIQGWLVNTIDFYF